MQNRLAPLAFVLLTGCFPTVGVLSDDPYVNSSQYEPDRLQCAYEAQRSTASAPATFSLSQNMAQDIATGMRQGELMGACMNAKRAAWVSQQPAPDNSARTDELNRQLKELWERDAKK